MVAVSERLRNWALSPDSRVAVTGATGWIGTALAHVCSDLGLTQASGRLRLFGSQPRIFESAGRDFTIEPLDGAAALGDGDWLVFHLAFLGKERTQDLAPDDFSRINDAVLAQAQALIASAARARLVFSSSGAVYRPDRSLVGADGNPYGYMKVQHEARIRQWAVDRTLPLVTARIFNIGGPYINKQALYALSDFIDQARRTGSIRIGAAKPVFRSFVHVEELCHVLFESVLDPALDFVCYDTAGREIVEIADLARAVGRALDIDVTIERPSIVVGAASDWYVGDGKRYQSTLASMELAATDLNEIVAATAAFMSLPSD